MKLLSHLKKIIYRNFYWLILPKSKHHIIPLLPELTIKSSVADATAKTIFYRKKEITKTYSLSKLKNLFNDNQFCFLVGEGPSIQNIYFKRDGNSFFIGTNTAIELPKHNEIHFDLYLLIDPNFIHKRFDIVKDVARRKIPCVLNAHAIKAICEKEAALLKKMTIFLVEEINKQTTEKNLSQKHFSDWVKYQPNITLHPETDRIGFCADIRKGVFYGGIELFWMLQIAYFIGFKEIALLGLDLIKEENNLECEDKYSRLIKPSFEVVRNLMNKEPLKVINLSLESRLPSEILPKMTYEQFLSNHVSVV